MLFEKIFNLILRRKLMKKTLITLTALLFLTSPINYIYSANDPSISNDLKIQEIYDQRSKLTLENKNDSEEYVKLGQELENLGVEFLSTEQVQEKNAQAIKNSSNTNQNLVQPQVAVPISSSVVWSSFRNRFVKNGVEYEVQHLTAEPNSKSSNLKGTGLIGVSSSISWQAGLQGLAKTAVFESASKVPGVDVVLTVYDAVADFVKDTNFSRKTEVTDIQVNYSWSYIQSFDFMYVKKVGSSDDTQVLSYRSSNISGDFSWNIPTFAYKSNGAIKSTKIKQGSKSFSNTPTGHRKGDLAVAAYLDPAKPSTSFVTRLELIGIESKKLKTINGTLPAFPSQLK